MDNRELKNYSSFQHTILWQSELEYLEVLQLQRFLDDYTDYLDTFQSSFRPGCNMETAVVTLVDN